MAEITQATEQFLDDLRLNMVAGIGPRLYTLLINRFGSSTTVLRASREELQSVSGIGAKVATLISEATRSELAQRELARCKQQGIHIFSRQSDDYPRLLSEIPDPPGLLYCKGSFIEQDELSVAIVGSRRCTLYGRQQAELIGRKLAQAGATVVSGLARGIDAAAHRGALSAGGRTLAVFATGLATVYPPEHRELADEITQSGGLITEFCLDQAPLAGLFPQRNRIISGLSLGVVVVEASRKSGALHTARHAMEQGRDVFVLPGRVDSPASQACHDLIRDGATLIRNADDVLEDLGPLVRPVVTEAGKEVHVPRELSLTEQEQNVLNLLTVDPQNIDEVLGSAEIGSSRVLSTLTILEMKGLVQRLPGNRLVRTPRGM